MLTVKHIRFDGAESIDHAERALFYPSDAADMRGMPSPHLGGCVSVVRPSPLGIVDHSDGTVYVMNEAGSTVAKYDLGDGRKMAGATGENASVLKAA